MLGEVGLLEGLQHVGLEMSPGGYIPQEGLGDSTPAMDIRNMPIEGHQHY